MTAFFFNNSYLNGIHNGIQAGHALNRMWVKYLHGKGNEEYLKTLIIFSKHYETWAILDGGDDFKIQKIVESFESKDNVYPWELFQEEGLRNLVSSVAIILPEKFYSDDSNIIGKALLAGVTMSINGYSAWDLELLKLRVSSRRAG